MDAFESLIAGILRADGYWVEPSVRIDLSAADKRSLNNYSMPRPELDIVAYRPATNDLLAIECKSYFDSGGVHVRDLKGGRNAARYKMFVDAALREMVLTRLVEQMQASGMVHGNPAPKLVLAYGHATTHNEALLREWFEQNGWFLLGPDTIKERVSAMADEPYDNQVASVVAKLFRTQSTPRGATRTPLFP